MHASRTSVLIASVAAGLFLLAPATAEAQCFYGYPSYGYSYYYPPPVYYAPPPVYYARPMYVARPYYYGYYPRYYRSGFSFGGYGWGSHHGRGWGFGFGFRR